MAILFLHHSLRMENSLLFQQRSHGPMVKAPAYGAGDSRFESWCDREKLFLLFVLLTRFELVVPISSSARIVRRTPTNVAKRRSLDGIVVVVQRLELRIRRVSLVGWSRESYGDSMERSIGTTLFHLERRREREIRPDRRRCSFTSVSLQIVAVVRSTVVEDNLAGTSRRCSTKHIDRHVSFHGFAVFRMRQSSFTGLVRIPLGIGFSRTAVVLFRQFRRIGLRSDVSVFRSTADLSARTQLAHRKRVSLSLTKTTEGTRGSADSILVEEQWACVAFDTGNLFIGHQRVRIIRCSWTKTFFSVLEHTVVQLFLHRTNEKLPLNTVWSRWFSLGESFGPIVEHHRSMPFYQHQLHSSPSYWSSFLTLDKSIKQSK